MAVQHVRRDVGHHVVPEKAFRELRPLAEAIDRKAESPELAPDVRMGRALENPLIFEERQVEVEAGGATGARPVDGGRAPAGGVGDVVDRRRPQQPIRVVDGIAGEILRASRLTIQDVVGHDAVAIGAHPRHHARVSGPRGAREHALHAPRHDAPLGQATQRRHAHARVGPVEGREPVEADQDDAGHGPKHSAPLALCRRS